MAHVSIGKITTKIGHCWEKLIPNQNTTDYTLAVLSQEGKKFVVVVRLMMIKILVIYVPTLLQ